MPAAISANLKPILLFRNRFVELHRFCADGMFHGTSAIQRLSGNPDPSSIQVGHGDLKTFTFFAKEIGCRDFHILECYLHGARPMKAHFTFIFTDD
jgi:hypothetical protein